MKNIELVKTQLKKIFSITLFALVLFSGGCKKNDNPKTKNSSQNQENNSTEINEDIKEKESSPIANLVSLIHKNSGYYFDDKNFDVVYLDSEGTNKSNSYFTRREYSVNFDENKLIQSGVSRTQLFYSSSTNVLKLETEGDKITKFRLYDMYDYFPAGNTEEEVLNLLYEKIFEKFAKFTGSYIDKETGAKFELNTDDKNFYITVREKNGLEISEQLKISDAESIKGKTYKLAYNSNIDELTLYKYVENTNSYLEPDYYEDYDYYVIWERVASISFVPQYMPKSGEPVTLKGWKFTAGENNQEYYYVGDGDLRIGSENEKYFSTYKDFDGYCYLAFKDHRIRLIDGEHITWAFDLNNLNDGFIEDEYLYICNNGKIINNIKASSVLTEGKQSYSPENLLYVFSNFSNSSTNLWVKNNKPWVEGVPGDGIGEGIEFDIEPTNDYRMVAINLTILNGYVDPLKPNLFRENGRVKKLLIITDSGYEEEIEFEDTVMFTTVQIPVDSTHVRMIITEVYSGTKYNDTCISALAADYQLWDK